jgi:hypothetical protein
VAFNTFFIAGRQLAGPEVVAIGASQPLHFRKHVCCVGMTVDAYLLYRFRLVALEGMTGSALNIFLEPVQGMALGSGDLGNFQVFLLVAGHALFTGDNGFVMRPIRYLSGTLYNHFEEHHIFFVEARVVACMAVDVLVHAGLPAVKRILHEMAVQTELGVVLGVIVQVQRADAQSHSHQPDQKADHDFKFYSATVV